MVKQHSQLMQISLGICDLTVISAAWITAYELRFHLFAAPEPMPTPHVVMLNLLMTLLLSLLVLTSSGLYRPRRDKSFLLELGHIIKAGVLIWMIVIAAIYFTQANRFTRGMLLILLPCMTAALVIERGFFRSALRAIRRRGWNLRHGIIIGTGRLAQSTLHKLKANSWTGIHIAGFVTPYPGPSHPHNIRGVPVLGSVDDLQQIIHATHIDCVFVALASQQAQMLPRLIDQLEQTAVDVRIIPDLYLSRFPMNITVSEIDGLAILSLRENPLAGWPTVYKRVFDVVGALFGLAIFALPMATIALLIKCTSPGPVIYRQRRISFGGKPFDMLKFRTMVPHAEAKDGPVFALPGDPRCTRIGRWLRGSSLDELPQLWNVLIGHMSLVGPRPERPEMLEKIRGEIPGFPMRLKIRAGLTGWAQINGFRGRTSFRKRLQYDLYYLNNWSPMLDLRIVVATLFRGFRHPNAY